MRPFLLSLTAATALVSAVSLAPQAASAMPTGAAAAIQAATEDANMVAMGTSLTVCR